MAGLSLLALQYTMRVVFVSDQKHVAEGTLRPARLQAATPVTRSTTMSGRGGNRRAMTPSPHSHSTWAVAIQRTLKVDGHAQWFPNAPRAPAPAYQYRIETSLDNQHFTTVLDRTSNTKANNVEFGEFAPIRCRWIRLTITGRPKDVPLAVFEFTAFGQSVEGSGAK